MMFSMGTIQKLQNNSTTVVQGGTTVVVDSGVSFSVIESENNWTIDLKTYITIDSQNGATPLFLLNKCAYPNGLSLTENGLLTGSILDISRNHTAIFFFIVDSVEYSISISFVNGVENYFEVINDIVYLQNFFVDLSLYTLENASITLDAGQTLPENVFYNPLNSALAGVYNDSHLNGFQLNFTSTYNGKVAHQSVSVRAGSFKTAQSNRVVLNSTGSTDIVMKNYVWYEKEPTTILDFSFSNLPDGCTYNSTTGVLTINTSTYFASHTVDVVVKYPLYSREFLYSLILEHRQSGTPDYFPYAIGGTTTEWVNADGHTMRSHLFNSSSSILFSRGGEIRIVVQGGGGGGSGIFTNNCGGGGAAAVPVEKIIQIGITSYPIVVGGGGSSAYGSAGGNGSDSSFAGYVSVGGLGANTGSGANNSLYTGAAVNYYFAGSGAGAISSGIQGYAGNNTSTAPGVGGPSTGWATTMINDTPYVFGGSGGGACGTSSGTCASFITTGGGSPGSNINWQAGDAVVNRGAGGGGGTTRNSRVPGKGSSGFVYIEYRIG